MTTDDRLRKLERTNRWLRCWCVGLTILCGGMFLMGAAETSEKTTTEEIRAKRIVADFIVVGHGGVTVMDTDVDRPEKASNLVLINANKDGAKISMNERTENGRLILRSELMCSKQKGVAGLTLFSRDKGLENLRDSGIPLRPDVVLATTEIGSELAFHEDYITRIHLANMKKKEVKDNAWMRIRDKRGNIAEEWLTK